MPSRYVVFVAFEDQPNLGIGYMASVLQEHGFNVELLDFRKDSQEIVDAIRDLDPLIIGLSIIYQYYTSDFSELVNKLRDQGVTCPICAGGHFPSLEPTTTLKLIPNLDFIIRFEGEYTLVDIVKRLYDGLDWKDVKSIAYKKNGKIITTPLRPLITDLDKLPFPKRWAFNYHCLGVLATSILASRGCPRQCSFCSIRRFYSIPPGLVRRTRSPENVVEEMLRLYRDNKIKIFLFQDDDFSLMSKRDREWSRNFAKCLKKSELSANIMWKISCRSDEVEPEIFLELKSAGLYLVYLGIESGNETGLSILNKHISVEQNLQAIKIIKSLGLRYDFGFMLFDPTSTIDSVLENVRFLRQICGDGSATASFGKTLPYAGTELEKQLRLERRLQGDVRFPDYNYVDIRTDYWFDYLCKVFYPWVYGIQSLQSQLRWALFELDVMNHFFSGVLGLDDHQDRINYLVSWYNEIFFNIIEDSADIFQSSLSVNNSAAMSIYKSAEEQRLWLENQLALQRQEFFTKSGLPIELVVGKIEQNT